MSRELKSSRSTRLIALIAACGLAAALVAGCGGSGADGSSDPQELLEATFDGEGETIDSGVVEASIDASAGDGSLTGSLSGPFEARADDEPPLVDMEADLKVNGAGEDTEFAGGLTITEDAGFVTLDGTAYAVEGEEYDTFLDLFAQSAAQQTEQGEEGSALFGQLGIDPASWLSDVSNEGVEEVGGTETVHISGTADVGRIIDDAQALDPTGAALDAPGGSDLADAVETATIDVWTGTEDELLRRLELNVELGDPRSDETLDLVLMVGISEVNEPQSFEAPANARPLEEIVPGGIAGVGGVPSLDDLSPGGSAGGSGSGGAGSGGSASAFQECIDSARTPEEFADCTAQR
jgi:hypothetical protein